MGQLKGFWRDSWWMWCIFFAIAIAMSIYVMPFFIMMLPILIGIYVYFAFMRYDKDGNDIGGGLP